jgi:hypothetical protein
MGQHGFKSLSEILTPKQDIVLRTRESYDTIDFQRVYLRQQQTQGKEITLDALWMEENTVE